VQYAESVQFLLVYIAESHAVDEWPVGETIIKKQHTNTNERIEVCRQRVTFGTNGEREVNNETGVSQVVHAERDRHRQ